MPSFSETSKKRLATCDERLQRLFNEVVKHYDCSVLGGHRDQKTQDDYFAKGLSKLTWPKSKHNSNPSKAVDVTPYPVNWGDKHRHYMFAGYVLGVARKMGIELRWGGDWDGDTQVRDNAFDDLVHFEIVE